MKTPRLNAGDEIRKIYISDITSLNRLRNLWGSIQVDGIELMSLRQYYYPTDQQTDTYKRLYTFLGAYKGVEDSDTSKIKSGYLTFNKSSKESLENTEQFIADNLNTLWRDPADTAPLEGRVLTTSIVIGGLSRPVGNEKQTTLLDPSSSKEQLKVDIKAHYDQLWDTCKISQEGTGVLTNSESTEELSVDDPWLNILSVNALRSIGVACNIKDVEIGIVKTTKSEYQYSYVVTLEIPYRVFRDDTNIVESIAEIIDNKPKVTSSVTNSLFGLTNTDNVRKLALASDFDIDDIYTVRPYTSFSDAADNIADTYSDLWYKYNGNWYLKAAALKDPMSFGIKHRDMMDYIISTIESGYKKKPVPWYKKALAIIIVVVSFVLAPVTGGSSLTWTSAALAVLFAATVVTLLAIVTAILGHEEWSGAFAEVNKEIEPLVLIASIITAGNFTALLKAQLKEYATEELIQEVGTMLGDDAELFTRVLNSDLSMNSLNAFLGSLTTLVTLYSNNKLESISKANKALQEEADKLNEEGTRERNIIAAMAKAELMPATADWSIYAEQFDMPYERGGGPLAMGNIQKTTKTAMRLGKYNDPIFESIRLL